MNSKKEVCGSAIPRGVQNQVLFRFNKSEVSFLKAYILVVKTFYLKAPENGKEK